MTVLYTCLLSIKPSGKWSLALDFKHLLYMFIQFQITWHYLMHSHKLGGLQSASYIQISFQSIPTSSCGMKTLKSTTLMLKGLLCKSCYFAFDLLVIWYNLLHVCKSIYISSKSYCFTHTKTESNCKKLKFDSQSLEIVLGLKIQWLIKA